MEKEQDQKLDDNTSSSDSKTEINEVQNQAGVKLDNEEEDNCLIVIRVVSLEFLITKSVPTLDVFPCICSIITPSLSNISTVFVLNVVTSGVSSINISFASTRVPKSGTNFMTFFKVESTGIVS